MSENKEMLSSDNAEFWSEPCGTQAFKQFALEQTPLAEQLEAFDNWYFGFYPYLLKYLESLPIEGAEVLEIGIGMGTVSRYLASRAKQLTCIDIAPGAIKFVRNTFDENSQIEFVCQDILDFAPNKRFDLVVAIGSLHHTGNLAASLVKVESLVNSEGTLFIMVYNAFQLRRILKHPLRALRELYFSNLVRGSRRKFIFEENDDKLRGQVDSNLEGHPAPHTVFSSRSLFSRRNNFVYLVKLENFNKVPFLHKLIDRKRALFFFSKVLGCDIYAVGKKYKL